MNYIGDFDIGATVQIWFNTFSSDDPSASVTMTDFADTDVHIYKDDGLTQRTNAAGVAIDIDVDTYVGVHKITIDTADNTVGDFFEAGHDYAVVIEGVTVDAATINPVVGTFSIANRRVAGQMCVSSIEGLASQTSFTLTAGEASANDDAYNGCTIIVTDQVTKIQKAIGHILDYTGATRTVTLHAAPLQTGFTMAIGDSVEIIATSCYANVNTVMQQTQTANDNGADINTLITNVGSPADIDGGGATLSENLKKLADDNGGATFDAETDSLNKIRDNELTTIAGDVVNIDGDAMRGTDSAALASVVGALNDVAAAGEVTDADTLVQYIKQLLNVLIGAAGIAAFPAEAGPANDVSLAEVIRAIHVDVTGLAGDVMRGTDGANTTVPDAAGVAPTATEVVDEFETQSQVDPTGFHVNVLEVGGTAQTANDNGADINAILIDTDELQTDDTPAAIAALPDVAAINAQVLDVMNVDTFGEPAQGAPGAAISIFAKINYLYKAWRNKRDQDATTKQFYNDAGDTVDHKRTVADGGASYSETEVVGGP